MLNRKTLARDIAVITAAACLSPITTMAEEGSFALEEVVVTATRRAETVQDIPYNISAVGADAIENAGITDLNSLTRMIPGLANADMGPRTSGTNSNLIIRGLNGTNPASSGTAPNVAVPPVSTYLGDTPLFLNLKLTDIERVEVLRGPQGTLYGSGSVGGTLRFIFNKPNMDETTAEVAGKIGFTEHSDDKSTSVDFVGNLPLTDNLALRASAGYEHIGGFIDAKSRNAGLADPSDPANSSYATTSEKDADDADIKYLRASLLWDATDDVEVLLSYHRQEDDVNGNTVQGQFSDKYENDVPIEEPMNREVDLYSLDVTADIGFATFTSSTSYTDMEFDSVRDNSAEYQNFDDTGWYYGGFPRITVVSNESGGEQSFAQEFRLVSNSDGNFDWVIGAFYRDQEIQLDISQDMTGIAEWADLYHPVVDFYYGAAGVVAPLGLTTFADYLGVANAALQPSANQGDKVYTIDRDVVFEDKAIFGEFTYHINDDWQTTVGFRSFWQEFEQSLYQTAPICGAWCADDGLNANGLGSLTAAQSEKFKDQIFKFNTSYDLTDETMIYFTWAEGFRHGGANAFPTTGPFAASADLITFKSDTATNWEMGVKGYLSDTVRYTLSTFLIEWQDMQFDTATASGGFPAVFNGNDAESKGAELEINAQLSENLSMTLGYSYVDAQLTEDLTLTEVVAFKGDYLPGVPMHQASLAVDYFQPLNDDMELHYHLDGSYRSSVQLGFNDDPTNPQARDFAEMDGFDVWNGSVNWTRDNITVGLFVNNITNEQQLSATFNRYASSPTQQYGAVSFVGRPRNYGISARYSF